MTMVKFARTGPPRMRVQDVLLEMNMANLVRLSPIEELFNDLGKGFWVRPFASTGEQAVSIKVDVEEKPESYVVKADVPGVKREDLAVEVHEDRVSVRAESKREEERKEGNFVYQERSYGAASRTIALPGNVDAQQAKAEYRDGVLTLTLPKKMSSASKRLTIS